MTDGGPEPNDPLSPYYPSEVPDVPGNGRKWFAVLLVLVMLSGGLYGLWSLLLSV